MAVVCGGEATGVLEIGDVRHLAWALGCKACLAAAAWSRSWTVVAEPKLHLLVAEPKLHLPAHVAAAGQLEAQVAQALKQL